METALKLDVKKLLEQLAQSQNSGCLELKEEFVSWKIYLQQGNLKYVDCSIENLEQLKFYLHYLQLKKAIKALERLPDLLVKPQSSVEKESDSQNLYGNVIPWLLSAKQLDLSEGIKLIEQISQDALSFCLWLDRGTSSWHAGHSLPAWIPLQLQNAISLNVPEFLRSEQTRLKQWQQCSPELLSVHQRPYFAPGWENKSLPTSGSLNLKTLQELTQVLRGRTSIRQLSVLLRKDELNVGKILSPYIDSKIVYLHHAPTPLDKLPSIPRLENDAENLLSGNLFNENNAQKTELKTWKIVCIDDSPTILSEIKRFLNQEKFAITAIDDPVQAVSQIFTINPDLILLDITMPRINGYKLCGLLRSSGKCDRIPIIMVTSNTGLIDKARAKIAGATDYFTKPFTKEGLTQIIEKHLN
ncbi:response regulator [Pleurocapsa sp. FMAR1]|uniref:response regulator n=1 Tax=Pleurocapsa sp. FMAR1 TaxID=3040204 RepID=UPI0029C6F049|nr:response regulator [Pleurocapsa sp. FMAR1]